VAVVSDAAADESVVVAEVSVASGIEAHVPLVSAAPAAAPVVVASVSVASTAAADVSLVSPLPEMSAVVAEVSAASASVAGVSPVSALLELSVVVAEVSVASAAVADVSLVSPLPELSAVVADVPDSEDCAATPEAGGGGSCARAAAANRSAQRIGASTATVRPSTLSLWRSQRLGPRPGTATELHSICASTPWLRSLSRVRVSHLKSGAQDRRRSIGEPKNKGTYAGPEDQP
jgi:hypothetical protein